MAQLTRPALHAEIEGRFPDNETALITPAVARAFFHNLVDSATLEQQLQELLAEKVGVPLAANLAVVRQNLAEETADYDPGRDYMIAGNWNRTGTVSTVTVRALAVEYFSPLGILRTSDGKLSVVNVDVAAGTTSALGSGYSTAEMDALLAGKGSAQVQQQHTLQLATLGVQASPVMAYLESGDVAGYATLDEALADHRPKTFMRFNVAFLTLTQSNDPLNPGWAAYVDGAGATVQLGNNVVLSLPGGNVDTLLLKNFFIFQAPGTRGGKVKLLASSNGSTPVGYLPLLDGRGAVPFELSGGTFALRGSYGSLLGTGTVHLFEPFDYSFASPGLTLVKHEAGAGGGGAAVTDAYTKSETDQKDSYLQAQLNDITANGGPVLQKFVFEPGYADSYTFTAGADVVGVYGTEGLSNVSSATYYIGIAVTALPLTIQAGDKIRIVINRQTATQVASVVLSK